MSVKIKHRRYGSTATVDDRLGAALVKQGTHAYATAEDASSVAAKTVSQPRASKRKGHGKGNYERRDMQAKP